jgi:iron-sulfur cluster insertion protein
MKLDESAVSKLKELLLEESNSSTKLRVFVQGGGCSGMQYGFTFDDDKQEDDFELNYDTVAVVVDSMSMQYLNGATIRYNEDVMGSNFVIDNPNAETTCGCGSSFSPT